MNVVNINFIDIINDNTNAANRGHLYWGGKMLIEDHNSLIISELCNDITHFLLIINALLKSLLLIAKLLLVKNRAFVEIYEPKVLIRVKC